MAEKEERICVCIEKERYKTFDRAVWQTLKYMIRQEAIKKISSHLLMCDISTMDTDEIAEAALNALLGE